MFGLNFCLSPVGDTSKVISLQPIEAKRSEKSINRAITAVSSFYDYHLCNKTVDFSQFERFHAVYKKEQQQYIEKYFGDSYKKLFCSNVSKQYFNFIPVAKTMTGNTFNRWLNKLAETYNIRSKDGEIWYFTSHQFRRTVATVMTNAGVRDLIIQKYLRHRNPDMQNHYKHLLKQVIGDEYQELIKEKNNVFNSPYNAK